VKIIKDKMKAAWDKQKTMQIKEEGPLSLRYEIKCSEKLHHRSILCGLG
jgi:hypothetical protein